MLVCAWPFGTSTMLGVASRAAGRFLLPDDGMMPSVPSEVGLLATKLLVPSIEATKLVPGLRELPPRWVRLSFKLDALALCGCSVARLSCIVESCSIVGTP